MSAPLLADARTTAGLRSLPVVADDGFPQSFLLALDGRTYRVDLHVDVPEHVLGHDGPVDPRATLDVVGSATASAPAILVAAVVRQDEDGGTTTLLRRRLLPGQVHHAGELVLVLDEVRVAVGNLNGAGAFGSVLRARVGTR